MICPQCNRELPDDARFCKHCGMDFFTRGPHFSDLPEPPGKRINTTLAAIPTYSYGVRLVKGLRALAVIFCVLIAACGGIWGGMLIHDNDLYFGIGYIVAGALSAILVFFFATVYITRFDNISRIGYNTEKNEILTDNAIHLISQLVEEVMEQSDMIIEQSKAFTELGETMGKLVEATDEQNRTLRKLRQPLDAIQAAAESERAILEGLITSTAQIAEAVKNLTVSTVQHSREEDERNRQISDLVSRQADLTLILARQAKQAAPVHERPSAAPQAMPAYEAQATPVQDVFTAPQPQPVLESFAAPPPQQADKQPSIENLPPEQAPPAAEPAARIVYVEESAEDEPIIPFLQQTQSMSVYETIPAPQAAPMPDAPTAEPDHEAFAALPPQQVDEQPSAENLHHEQPEAAEYSPPMARHSGDEIIRIGPSKARMMGFTPAHQQTPPDHAASDAAPQPQRFEEQSAAESLHHEQPLPFEEQQAGESLFHQQPEAAADGYQSFEAFIDGYKAPEEADESQPVGFGDIFNMLTAEMDDDN